MTLSLLFEFGFLSHRKAIAAQLRLKAVMTAKSSNNAWFLLVAEPFSFRLPRFKQVFFAHVVYLDREVHTRVNLLGDVEAVLRAKPGDRFRQNKSHQFDKNVLYRHFCCHDSLVKGLNRIVFWKQKARLSV